MTTFAHTGSSVVFVRPAFARFSELPHAIFVLRTPNVDTRSDSVYAVGMIGWR